MNEYDAFWLFESSNRNGIENIDNGKWMLFYPNDKMNEMWKFATRVYKANQLTGVRSMKCSTAKENPRASSSNNGIIILYSSYSADEKYITKIGQNILATFKYQEFPYMYYKSDEQTWKGTRATGCEKNHMYRLRTTDGCIHTTIARTPHTVYDWMEGTLEKQYIKKLLACRADEEDIEFIASLNLEQLETMCFFYFDLDARAGNVAGTPNSYCHDLALVYILDYDISPKRILRLYTRLANDGMPYLAVYSHLKYIQEYILHRVDDHASLVDYGRFCEDVLGIPPKPKEQPTDQKYIIVMDCETTGLIGQYGAHPHPNNLNLFPRIVQFSWGLYTEDGEQVAIKDFIIEPDGWTMNGSDRIHGISQERALTEGVDIKGVLNEFKNDIENNCLKLVCHNVDFDKVVVASEFVRANIPLTEVATYCTMKETADFCKLYPRKRGQYKWPKLDELYRKCFNAELENAHNSYYDVINCAKCYFEVQRFKS
jgi:DNA polymerase III epsilon subunit-like protein